MFGGRGRAVAACSKMVPKGISHIRLLEFKVKSNALLEFRIPICQRFPDNHRVLLEYLWNVPRMEMGSTQREQKLPWGKTELGFQSWASARDQPPSSRPRHFHVYILFMLSIRNMFQFNIWEWFPLPLPPKVYCKCLLTYQGGCTEQPTKTGT